MSGLPAAYAFTAARNVAAPGVAKCASRCGRLSHSSKKNSRSGSSGSRYMACEMQPGSPRERATCSAAASRIDVKCSGLATIDPTTINILSCSRGAASRSRAGEGLPEPAAASSGASPAFGATRPPPAARSVSPISLRPRTVTAAAAGLSNPGMHRASEILVALVALEHLLFLVMEMFLWQHEAVMARFGSTPEFAAQSAVLAMNQGLYNGFLSAGLVWSLRAREPEQARAIARFFLACVVVAGVFGGATAKPSIAVVQALPALLALATTYLLRPARREHAA